MAKISDLEETADAGSYSASGSVSEPLRQPNVQPEYDTQSVADSISSITQSLARPEVGSDDLRYQSVDQLNRELETAILSSLKLKNDWARSSTYEERNSLENQKRVWDTRLSAVSAALLVRIPEEREQYLQKLRDIKQEGEDWERAYQQRKKQEEVRSHSDSSTSEEAQKTPEETVEEIYARVKKQTEERIQRHCPPIPVASPSPSTSSRSSTSAWKYLRGKLGDFKDFIFGDSPQVKTREVQGNKKLNEPGTQERKHPITATATTTNNQQPKNADVRWLDEWREVNPAPADDLSNAAIPSSPQASGTHIEIRVNDPMESPLVNLVKAEVCQYNSNFREFKLTFRSFPKLIQSVNLRMPPRTEFLWSLRQALLWRLCPW